MNHNRISLIRAHATALLILAGAIALNGCAFSGGGVSNAGAGSSSGTGLGSSSTQFGGVVHGGQNPVTGAKVILWAAGTTGTYGTAPTKVATTTSLGDGSFTFDNSSGVSPCTTGQYLYITATGGDSGTGSNNYTALMAAIPQPCSSATGAAYVHVNEQTTVAAATALQQFMSIDTSATAPYAGSGTVPWSIGAPSTNVTGLANAFTQVGNLVNTASGTSVTSTVASTFGGTTYTTTITPDSAKIIGLADILAICVNDTTGGSNCTGTNGVLTFTSLMKSGTAVIPIDTIQAAYNMATLPNPSLYSGSTDSSGTAVTTYWTHSTNSSTYLSTLWGNISGMPAFPGYSATAPTDTVIQVKWANSFSAYTTYPQLAFDSNGNIWFAQGNGTSSQTQGYLAQYNQAGQMQFAPVTSTTVVGGWDFSAYTGTTTFTVGSPKADALAVDTNNNAWYAGFYVSSQNNAANTTANSSGTLESPLVKVTPAGASSGYLVGISPGSLVIDGSNNLYFNNIPNGYTGNTSERYYLSELLASGTTPYSTYYGGVGRLSSTYFNGIAIDGSSNQLVWGLQNTCSGSVYRTTAALEASGGTYPTAPANSTVSLSSTSTPTTCVLQGAIDANNNMWGTNGYLEYIVAAGTGSVTSPTVTAFASTGGTGLGGLTNAGGVAVDGANNVWVTNSYSTTVNSVTTYYGGISEFSAVFTNGVPVITPLSPAGNVTTPVYGFANAYNWAKPSTPRIDSSGNIWMENNGNSYLYYLVGIAAPVVTPTSLAVKNGKIGARP